MKRIYLDYNATTPISPEVKAALIADIELYGNASSMHAAGREARNHLEAARRQVAALIGAAGAEGKGDGGLSHALTFTSGGSESNNTVFASMEEYVFAQKADGKTPRRSEIITSAIEHPCVLNSARRLERRGFKVTYLPVDAAGKIDMASYRAALSEKTLLVSVMLANNEIGTIQDMAEIAALAKDAGAFVHSDIVQAAGKIPVDVEALRLDYATVSAHKLYAPKGAGALYHRAGAPIFPLINGGHQEDGLRAGTYNNLGIFAFGAAAEWALKNLPLYGTKIRALRDRLRDGLLKNIPNIAVNGHPTDVLPNTLDISFPGAEGESILLALDLAGIEVSTGSACASGSLEPSHVLLATGATPERAHGSIRFSLGWGLSEADIDYVIETTPPIIARLRAMSTVA